MGTFSGDHYDQFGWRERRNPNEFFDTNWYLSTYTDVAAAGVNPLRHYDEYGWREGRVPSPGFDGNIYRVAYSDVASAGVNPLTHYIQFGRYEGRSRYSTSWVPTMSWSGVGSPYGQDDGYVLVDDPWYRWTYPDVAAAEDNVSPPPPPPIDIGGPWYFINSPGMPGQLSGTSFDFPSHPGSVHMLMRPTGPINGRVRLRFRMEGGPVYPVQGITPTVSLMFQRAGDNWFAKGGFASYRWYSLGSQGAGGALTPGERMLDYPLSLPAWANVYHNATDKSGFDAARQNCSMVGLAFGDPGAGATAHGVHGSGKFTILEFSVG